MCNKDPILYQPVVICLGIRFIVVEREVRVLTLDPEFGLWWSLFIPHFFHIWQKVGNNAH